MNIIHVSAIIAPLLLLQLLLIAIELQDFITIHWSIIFIPFYLLLFFLFIILIVLFIEYRKDRYGESRDIFLIIVLFLGLIAFTVFLVFLPLQLSHTIHWNIEYVFAPLLVYFALLTLCVYLYIIFKDFCRRRKEHKSNKLNQAFSMTQMGHI
jgi:MFS family permease